MALDLVSPDSSSTVADRIPEPRQRAATAGPNPHTLPWLEQRISSVGRRIFQPQPHAPLSILDVARRIGERRCEGQFLTYLGLQDAGQGGKAKAKCAFDDGEALLSQIVNRISLGILLCAGVEASVLAGQSLQARRTRVGARSIADESRVGAKSELGLVLARVDLLLSGQPKK